MKNFKMSYGDWMVLLSGEDYTKYKMIYNFRELEINSYYNIEGEKFHCVVFSNDEYKNFKRTNLIDKML